MLSLVMELCQLCKVTEESKKYDDARDIRLQLAEVMHDIMAEANSEIEVSAELFERHFQLTILSGDIENKCFECNELYQRKGGLIGLQISSYLTSVLRKAQNVESIEKNKKNNVINFTSFRYQRNTKPQGST